MDSKLRAVLFTVPLAFLLWFFIFALPAGHFWFKLTLSASLLAIIGLRANAPRMKRLLQFRWRHVWVGIVSAVLLYGIFWAGREISTLIFPFAERQISGVYASKSQLDALWIGLLLLLVMGPAEELYWHGFVQDTLSARFGPLAGVASTAVVYALVHASSLNFMLVAAAGVCGLYWGVLFQREERLVPVIVSHSLWDVLIFVLFPLN